MNTLEYYEMNSDKYINNTINLDNSIILEILKKNINSTNDKILEVGFGSGRELISLFSDGYNNLYGLDGNINFINNLKSKININLYCSKLPEIKINNKFDFIYSIATIFHLNDSERTQFFLRLYDLLKENGKILLSYNEEDRSNDLERVFYKLDKQQIELMMKLIGFKLLERTYTEDISNRFEWINDIYQKV